MAIMPSLGAARVAMGLTWPLLAVSSNALPLAPQNMRPIAGAKTTPAVGRPCSTSAMLTVNSPFLLQKLLRAVERIDEEEHAVGDVGQRSGSRLFFGDDGNAGRHFAQARDDEALGFFVGDGDRRLVGFFAGVRCCLHSGA